jgi:hypothetical protein
MMSGGSLSMASFGPCPSEEKRQIDASTDCSSLCGMGMHMVGKRQMGMGHQPVCGSDGVTYGEFLTWSKNIKVVKKAQSMDEFSNVVE